MLEQRLLCLFLVFIGNFLNAPIVSIYNRYVRLIKQLNSKDTSWDGTFLGQQLPESDYWFKLSYVDANGTRVEDKFLQKNSALHRLKVVLI